MSSWLDKKEGSDLQQVSRSLRGLHQRVVFGQRFRTELEFGGCTTGQAFTVSQLLQIAETCSDSLRASEVESVEVNRSATVTTGVEPLRELLTREAVDAVQVSVNNLRLQRVLALKNIHPA